MGHRTQECQETDCRQRQSQGIDRQEVSAPVFATTQKDGDASPLVIECILSICNWMLKYLYILLVHILLSLMCLNVN